jgi:hypothetical protein
MKHFIKTIWARFAGKTRLMANTYNAPNAGTSPTGIKSFKADGAIGRYKVVKRGVGTPTSEYVAIHAAETDIPLGITLDEVSAAEATALLPISVAVLNAFAGTILVDTAEAIVIDAYVCSNGDGTVKAAASGDYFIGRTLQASQAAGDIIEITPCYNPVVKA